jgi:hypothetical protein
MMPDATVAVVKIEYQILGRRTGLTQKGLQIETTPIREGWKACKLLCVVFCFNFSSDKNCESKIV